MATIDMRNYDSKVLTDEVTINLPNGDTILINNSLLRVFASAAFTCFMCEEERDEHYTEKAKNFYRAVVEGEKRYE